MFILFLRGFSKAINYKITNKTIIDKIFQKFDHKQCGITFQFLLIVVSTKSFCLLFKKNVGL